MHKRLWDVDSQMDIKNLLDGKEDKHLNSGHVKCENKTCRGM